MTGLDSTPREPQDSDNPDERKPVTENLASVQGHAYRVLGQLLDHAAAKNLPAIDWTITASGERVLGRCTAYPGPGQRRADFEDWRALLGTDASEAEASSEVPRLSARAESDNGRVAIEIFADLYDVPVITPRFIT